MPDLNKPYWQDYAELLRQLGLDSESKGTLPEPNALNLLLGKLIVQQISKPLRFVPTPPPPGTSYEAHIFQSGEISTRQNNWHDLCNALVWARYPRTKLAMNARHCAEIQAGNLTRRGQVRDALTLFDECGAVVVGDQPQLLQALAQRDWQALFCDLRPAWQQHMRVFLLGHALLEKLLKPYKAITAQVLIFEADADFLQADAVTQCAKLDGLLAIQTQAGLRLRSTTELSPLPLMGIPGWCTAQQQSGFYADLQVFRPPPFFGDQPVVNSDQQRQATVSHRETARRGRFDIGEGAEMTYSRPSPSIMKINHTLVDQRHRGKGLAHQLYRAMVEFARANQRTVIPVCAFVESMLRQNPDDADVLQKKGPDTI